MYRQDTRVQLTVEYVKNSPNLIFKVTKIGCGLAGFTPSQIAPLFRRSVEIKNIHLPIEFWNVLLNVISK